MYKELIRRYHMKRRFFTMELEVKEEGEILILRFKGEMDLDMVKKMREKIKDLLDSRANIKGFILNLSGITFIDSAGIGAILGYFKRVERLGGEFMVTNLTPQVERLLYLAGLIHLLEVVTHEEEALNRISKDGLSRQSYTRGGSPERPLYRS